MLGPGVQGGSPHPLCAPAGKEPQAVSGWPCPGSGALRVLDTHNTWFSPGRGLKNPDAGLRKEPEALGRQGCSSLREACDLCSRPPKEPVLETKHQPDKPWRGASTAGCPGSMPLGSWKVSLPRTSPRKPSWGHSASPGASGRGCERPRAWVPQEHREWGSRGESWRAGAAEGERARPWRCV